MKRATIYARMSARKLNKNRKAVQMLFNWLERCDNGVKLRPCYSRGSGKFSRIADYREELAQLCVLLGLRVETGNNAPRGGKCGEWLRIVTKFEERKEILKAERERESAAAAQAIDSYNRAKKFNFVGLVSVDEWRLANSKSKRRIAHRVAQSLGVLNDAGFRRALFEAMSEGGAEIWKAKRVIMCKSIKAVFVRCLNIRALIAVIVLQSV